MKILPYGIESLAIDPERPDTLFVGTKIDGVFRTDDGGAKWASVSAGLTELWINDLAVVPGTSTVYAATHGGGVFRSDDRGASWAPAVIGQLPETPLHVWSLAVAPEASPVVYAGTWGAGVYRSADGGLSWALGAAGPPNAWVRDVAVDPQNRTTVYAATWDAGISKSVDAGKSWRLINRGLTAYSYRDVEVDPEDPATLYAAAAEPGIFKSTDGGETWLAASDGIDSGFCEFVTFDPSDSSTLYAACYPLVKSVDGGETWFELGVRNITALAFSPRDPALTYAGSHGDGFYRSADGGESWETFTEGLPLDTCIHCDDPPYPAPILALAVDREEDGVVYASIGGEGMHRSADGGESWAVVDNELRGQTVNALLIDSRDPSVFYAAVSSFRNHGVYRSIDRGLSWTRLDAGWRQTSIASLTLVPDFPVALWAGTRHGAFSYISKTICGTIARRRCPTCPSESPPWPSPPHSYSCRPQRPVSRTSP